MSLIASRHHPSASDVTRSDVRGVTPRQAAVEVERGAVLVDIRSIGQRRRQGDVPGARTSGLARLDVEQEGGRTFLLLSATGWRAAFAAADLERRGIIVGFVTGGVEGWEAAGLAVHAYRHGQVSSR